MLNAPFLALSRLAQSDIDYSAVDSHNLSLLEQLWASWYLKIGNPVLATGMMIFLVHEIGYFGRFLPWYIVGKIPYFNKWKIQIDKVPKEEEYWQCAKSLLWIHFTVELPMMIPFHHSAEWIGAKTWQLPFPSWQSILLQQAFFFIFEDIYHYFLHRTLHWRPLYRSIHKVHHMYSAPFGLCAAYAHPLEIILLGFGTMMGPLVYCSLTGDLHLVTVNIWILLRLFQAIDSHSGYDFPWSLCHIIPFWSGADFHDYHHLAFVSVSAVIYQELEFLIVVQDVGLDMRH